MKDVCEPRKVSKAKPAYPLADPTVPLILVSEAGVATYAVTVAGKLALLRRADEGRALAVLSVWPGAARSDAFVVDDVPAALAALEAAQ